MDELVLRAMAKWPNVPTRRGLVSASSARLRAAAMTAGSTPSMNRGWA